MKKNKIYKITLWKIFVNLINCTAIVFGLTILLIFIVGPANKDSIIDLGFMFLFLLCLLVLCGLGLYPMYLCWTYYRHDKDVEIFINYQNSELHYITKAKTTKVIKFQDIIKIKRFSRLFINPCYHRLISKHEDTLIITSLLIIDMPVALPKVHMDLVDTLNLLLPKEEKNMP